MGSDAFGAWSLLISNEKIMGVRKFNGVNKADGFCKQLSAQKRRFWYQSY